MRSPTFSPARPLPSHFASLDYRHKPLSLSHPYCPVSTSFYIFSYSKWNPFIYTKYTHTTPLPPFNNPPSIHTGPTWTAGALAPALMAEALASAQSLPVEAKASTAKASALGTRTPRTTSTTHDLCLICAHLCKSACPPKQCGGRRNIGNAALRVFASPELSRRVPS
jgi:hypothetical protein